MARRKQSVFEDLVDITSKLPWWVGVVLAAIAYAWLHGIAVSEVATPAEPGMMIRHTSQSLGRTLASVGQYLLPLAFLSGAAISALARQKRKALHQQVATSADKDALNNMSWQEFEALVGEAFRRKGFAVTETGGGGADGGVDLALRRGNESILVQCKQWKTYKVGVSTVRELYGVMAAKRASGGVVVTSGVFTDEARSFASGKNIQLIDGSALHSLIGGVSAPRLSTTENAASPACPDCQGTMVKRIAKRGASVGKEFWGCSRYPVCKGTRPA